MASVTGVVGTVSTWPAEAQHDFLVVYVDRPARKPILQLAPRDRVRPAWVARNQAPRAPRRSR